MVQAHPNMMSADHAPLPFFRRPKVQTFLPMLTSLALHTAIVIFGYSVYRVAKTMTFHTEAPPHDVVWEPFDDGVRIDGIANPNVLGTGTEIKVPQGNTEMTDVESATFNPNQAKSLGGGLGGDSDNVADAAIGIGAAHGPRGPGGGLLGDGSGPSNVRIGRPDGDPYTKGSPHILGRTNASKIVYVCDATGSMNSVFSGLRDELQRAINGLAIDQSFNVVFFSDDKVLTLNPSLMLPTDANKTKAFSFLGDVSPRGLTNPLPAIRAAFAQKPEMIYVLTDGFDQVDSLESVYNEFATLNKDQHVRVNTILIGSPDQKDLVDLLARIAKDNRGTMKVVSKDAL